MIRENYNVLGVMSGTSLDGVDLAHIIFNCQKGVWSYNVIECQTVAYSNEWVGRLKEAVGYTKEMLEKLNDEYTLLLSGIIKTFIEDNAIKGLDAVCSHGHTILHQPQNGFTLQIGNKQELAKNIGITIVCDFRVQDVEMGGQGAPLVPIGDRLLFSDYSYCLNLGGFSNISFEDNGKRVAFDICAVNTVLNYYAGKLGLPYDNGGKIAAKGKMVIEMYAELNELEFYKKSYPKSLGFEYVKEVLLLLIEKYDAQVQDVLHTFTMHVAKQVADVINALPPGKLLVTGGGAYNVFLLNCMQELMPDTTIVVPDDKTIQYKEALIFGLLGVLKLRGEVNVLSSVTGAVGDHSSGVVFGV
ncbi:anhydro-N-acetylmuramic acid kinase [Flavobacterium rakeshii]|uniref:anhydro-N-acetylmuramic acid kinase n=1 Tax=Flavobacterium rakeshii TaxID=1038845 RepID=UPI002E7C33DF|nr:anhydro-N-acetylmuramic acid kinase [Flavobacterium rakeshii]MEE1896701.1 anhydro-N-acetylmuramic acid kinase [Flavobacterium rakeshii]